MAAARSVDPIVELAYKLTWQASLVLNGTQILTQTFAKVNVAASLVLTGFNSYVRYEKIKQEFPPDHPNHEYMVGNTQASILAEVATTALCAWAGPQVLVCSSTLFGVAKALSHYLRSR